MPVTISIVTTSKPLRHDEIYENEPIFPTPPSTSSGVKFTLVRRVTIHAYNRKSESEDTIEPLGGFGCVQSHAPATTVPDMTVQERVGTPYSTNRDRKRRDEEILRSTWEQGVTFKSEFKLTCIPSFHYKNMTISVRSIIRVQLYRCSTCS